MTHEILIRVNATSCAESNRLASDLEQDLWVRSDPVSLSRRRESDETQDLGALLVAVLSAPAIAEFAKGLADWMRRRNVVVDIAVDGSMSVSGPPEHVERIIKQLTIDKKPR